MSFEMTNEKTKNSVRIVYKYNFNNSFPFCKPTYLKLIEKTDYYLSTIQKYLQKNGLIEHIHNNTSCALILSSCAYINIDVSFLIKNYLIQYSNIYNLLSLLHYQNDFEVFIYLPIIKTYKFIYKEYINSNQGQTIISYSIFVKL